MRKIDYRNTPRGKKKKEKKGPRYCWMLDKEPEA